MVNKYRESLKHTIRDKLEKTGTWDEIKVNATLVDQEKREYGVDVVAYRESDKRYQIYFVDTVEVPKYIDRMKLQAIKLQQALPDFNLHFYLVTPKGTKKYNAGN